MLEWTKRIAMGRHPGRATPRLTIVLVVYKMDKQAEKTLFSLSPAYQRDVEESDYEVIVVENNSDEMLGEKRASEYMGNLRYFARDEKERTPVHAVNFGAAKARSTHLSIMIDGARMLTPGVIRNTLDVIALDPTAVVSVPSYHLGEKLQQIAINDGYDEATEAGLLAKIGWPENGYRLFEIGCFAGASQHGLFLPSSESNALTLSVKKWNAVGGLNPKFSDFGGGRANLDLFKRVLEYPGTPYFVLFGEGSFHQHHGGTTTGTKKSDRKALMAQIRKQDKKIRGDNSAPPQIQPILFGQIHPPAYRFIRLSLDIAERQ